MIEGIQISRWQSTFLVAVLALSTMINGYSIFLAGGGVRGGMVHGATDEFGWHSVENKVHVHDLYATILHLMGLDHERLTFRFGGRDYRLTDVHGHVIEEILA